MSDWYDKKAKDLEFLPGDKVSVLNLQLYRNRPKLLRRYSDVATVIKIINHVTYIIRGDAWHTKEKIVYIDKLKLKHRPSDVQTGPPSTGLPTGTHTGTSS